MMNTKTVSKQVISQKSFDQIKKIAKALDHQVKWDKQNHRLAWDDVDFTSLDDSTDHIIDPDANGSFDVVSRAIEHNNDLMTALNLNFHYSEDVTYLYHSGEDAYYQDSICIKDLDTAIHALLNYGRHGIWQKVHYNHKLFKAIQSAYSKMNDVSKF